ncbi:hypothetical protein ACFVAJ_20830 [Agromyces sp. NPDC057679]|uniref:hypothetical protein n=1 Tax=Agromyces sp. NPDC057679 TaxID=3346207 RepID=UPI00366B4389
MSRMLLVLSLGFGLGAILCAIQYVLIRAERFPRNPFIGLPGYSRKSDEVWVRAHEAARPWIGRAGVFAAIASVIAGVGLAVGSGMETTWDGLSVSSAASGAVAAGLYLFGANGAADEATRRMTGRRRTSRKRKR